MRTYKKYALIYLDKKGNELQRETIERYNVIEARETANLYFNTTMINDCAKITVKRIYPQPKNN